MKNQNFEEQQVRVKHEPPVEFVLILPRPTIGWPVIKKEEDVKVKRWVKSVKVTKFDAKWPSESRLFQTFFTCQHCQLVWKTQGHLTRHLKTCIKINPAGFECDNCGRITYRKYLMRQHMLKHSSERKFCCMKCGQRFKAKDHLLKHSRSNRINKCAACDVKFPCKLLLDRHRSEFHGNVFKCDKCSYQTRNQSHLMSHKRTHDKSVPCETCQKNFSSNHLLKSHQMQHRHGIHAAEPRETFDCNKCDRCYSSLEYLKRHHRNVHDENEVKCEVCDKIYKNRNSLLKHIRSHAKAECSICHKMVSKQFIARHMQSHSAENIFECDLCEHSTRSKPSLKYHVEGMHLLRKLVNNSKCREGFSDFKLLEKLQLKYGSSATSSEKKFKCDQCSKAYVTPIMLNRHKKIFHVDKLLECQICKKKVHQYHLKSHMKFHSPGNHFECDICDFKFKRKVDLERHVKGRHRNGALVCPFRCKVKFANFHQLIEHRKIHVGKKQWKCAKCEFQTISRQQLLGHIKAMKHKMSL